jgi:hypothetical protein
MAHRSRIRKGNSSPALIIARRHQSAPKDRPIEVAIKTALQEIHEGRYELTPEMKPNVFGKMEDDFWRTGTELLMQHPRVAEALEQLQKEVSDTKSNEWLEKREMLHEINCQMHAQYKWGGQTRWQGKDNRAMRMVNPMSPRAFIEKLRAAGIKADIEPSVKKEIKPCPETGMPRWLETEYSEALICLGRKVVRGVVGLYAWVDGEYKYVNKLQVPGGYEWTVMRFDEFDLPTNEEWHGWRTAILALVRHRVITEMQADKAFGRPNENLVSKFYFEQLQRTRG